MKPTTGRLPSEERGPSSAASSRFTKSAASTVNVLLASHEFCVLVVVSGMPDGFSEPRSMQF